MKTLNLDALSAVQRTLTLGGAVYPVEEMNVENFIAATKATEELNRDGKEPTMIEQLEASVAMIHRAIPSIEMGKLRKLSMEQLVAVSKFIRGEYDEEAMNGKAVEEPQVEGSEPKK